MHTDDILDMGKQFGKTEFDKGGYLYEKVSSISFGNGWHPCFGWV